MGHDLICRRHHNHNIWTVLYVSFIAIFLLTAPQVSSANSDAALFEISIEMIEGSPVVVSYPGEEHREIGAVIALPTDTRWPSYTASAWGRPGEVCASAVNAIHLLVSVEKEKGRTMSMIPKETIAPAAGPGASIVISSKASSGIFGAFAPPVGSEVSIVRNGSMERTPLGKDDLPQKGDTLIITVLKKTLPYMVEIENRPGGRITEWSGTGSKIIGRVIKPLAGTGRFEGTLFQRAGTLRANHCGVIDFSTSPVGQVGGFQIIPWDHALKSKEMQGAWDMTQWLIAGPADGSSPMAATFPLFKGALVPGPFEGEKLWDIWSTYGRKSLIIARVNGGPWQPMPIVSGRVDYALKNITHLKIYFPFTDEPQK
ncbi:MAG: hypothetical protein LLF78_00060 [Synergistaceae bacterium]|nr:hypothetical protein [Synergistaceae bacterium]